MKQTDRFLVRELALAANANPNLMRTPRGRCLLHRWSALVLTPPYDDLRAITREVRVRLGKAP